MSLCTCRECRSAQTAPYSDSSTKDKSLKEKEIVSAAVQGTCWGCRLCRGLGWQAVWGALGRQALAGAGGGDSSLNVRLGNSKRLASFPGFWSTGTAKGLGNHLLAPFIHSYLFNIY